MFGINPRIEQLSTHDLLAQFKGMVCRDHYDPCDTIRPSKFSTQELERELRRRLSASPGASENSAEDEE